MTVNSNRAFGGRFALSIRAKLAIVALVLLVIPWVGYNYVKTIERLLRDNQCRLSLQTPARWQRHCRIVRG
jgi:hypothetical protein